MAWNPNHPSLPHNTKAHVRVKRCGKQNFRGHLWRLAGPHTFSGLLGGDNLQGLGEARKKNSRAPLHIPSTPCCRCTQVTKNPLRSFTQVVAESEVDFNTITGHGLTSGRGILACEDVLRMPSKQY